MLKLAIIIGIVYVGYNELTKKFPKLDVTSFVVNTFKGFFKSDTTTSAK